MVRSCWLLVATEARITDNKLWDKNKIDKETISYYNMNMITQRNASKMPDHDEDPIVYLVNIIPFPDPDLLLCANLSV